MTCKCPRRLNHAVFFASARVFLMLVAIVAAGLLNSRRSLAIGSGLNDIRDWGICAGWAALLLGVLWCGTPADALADKRDAVPISGSWPQPPASSAGRRGWGHSKRPLFLAASIVR